MASGERRGYLASRESNGRDQSQGVRRSARQKNGWRDQQSSKTENKQRRKPDDTTSPRLWQECDGVGARNGTARRMRSSGGDAFQLKPTRTEPAQPRRQSVGNGDGRRSFEGRGERRRSSSSSSDGQQRGENLKGPERGFLNQFKSYEGLVSRAVQQWRENAAGFGQVETAGSQLWSLYWHLLEENIGSVVREGLSLRVWRCLHYPTIETLRKQQQKTGISSSFSLSLLFLLSLLFSHLFVFSFQFFFFPPSFPPSLPPS